MTSTAIIIPARYNSTRFPGKALAPVDGEPLVKRVADRCRASGYPVYISTDDQRIADVVKDFYTTLVDTKEYRNGTERCAGLLSQDYMDDYTQFVNVQVDLCDVTPEMIEKTVWHLQHYSITTLWSELTKRGSWDSNTVKLIHAGDVAQWFTRHIIYNYGYKHLGLYGIKRSLLERYTDLEVTAEETLESLEQLRWIKAGYTIGALGILHTSRSIDVPEDLA